MIKIVNVTSKKLLNFSGKLIFLARIIYKKVKNKFKIINMLKVIKDNKINFLMKKFENNINKKQFKMLILKSLNNKIYIAEQKTIIEKFK